MTATATRTAEEWRSMADKVEPRHDLWIDGAFVPSASGSRTPTVDPATGETLAEVAEAGAEDLDRAVAAARRAFDSGTWARRDPADRRRQGCLSSPCEGGCPRPGRGASR